MCGVLNNDGSFTSVARATILRYSCPSNYTLSGDSMSCSLTTTATISATPAYSCPSGYMVSGSACILYTIPTNLTVTAQGTSTISLSWNGGNVLNPAGVSIERTATTSDSFAQVITVSGSSTSYVDTNLIPGTQYQYRIRMILSDGTTYGPYTPVVSATTTVSMLPVLSFVSGNWSSLAFNWSDADPTVTSYDFVQTSPTSQLITSGTNGFIQYTRAGLRQQTKYCVVVVAHSPTTIATSSQVCASTTSSSIGGSSDTDSRFFPEIPLPLVANLNMASSSILFTWSYLYATTTTQYTLTETSPSSLTLLLNSASTSYELGNLSLGEIVCVTLVASSTGHLDTKSICPAFGEATVYSGPRSLFANIESVWGSVVGWVERLVWR